MATALNQVRGWEMDEEENSGETSGVSIDWTLWLNTGAGGRVGGGLEGRGCEGDGGLRLALFWDWETWNEGLECRISFSRSGM